MRPIFIAMAAAATLVPSLAHAERPRGTYVTTDPAGIAKAPSAIPHAAPTIFYINKNGGTYRPGNNDARTNYSSIPSQVSVISPWQVSASGWNQVKTCMVDMFSRWNITVTDVDPGNVPHYEIVIAGSPQDVGMGDGVGGVSPFTSDCSVIPNSIVYTFAEVYGTDYQAVCETSAQEVAHSFGLDHEHLCADPMTYLFNCGNKSFQDVDAPCGEYSDRECACGGSTQNSVEWLTERIGLAEPGGGNQAPTVSITAPDDDDTVAPGFAVSASASDDAAVARVEFKVDGTLASTDTSSPYGFTTGAGLSDGSHTVQATAFDAQGLSASDSITVTVQAGGGGDEPDAGPGGGGGGGGGGGDDDDDTGSGGVVTGGCAAGGGAGLASGLALLGLALMRRRRR